MNLTIINAQIIDGGVYRNGVTIVTRNGLITDVFDNVQPTSGDARLLDAKGLLVVPGFIDLQVNGGSSVFLTHDISVDTLHQMYNDHLMKGTTRMLPTIVTTSARNIQQAIEVVKTYMQAGNTGIAGLHIEGPFISYERKGAHNPKHIRLPDNRELAAIIRNGAGIVKKITVAPECCTLKQVAMLHEAGIMVSAGHTAITDDAVRPYFDAGIQCITHLYNAMSPFTGKEAGLTGATLDADVYASIIADGYHCSMTALRIAHRLKKGKLFLVSDATFIGEEDLQMDGIAFLHRKGVYYNKEGALAGSNITMHDAVRVAILQGGIGLPDVIEMATEIPAKVLQENHRYGRIESGYAADFNLLQADTLALQATVVNGKVVRTAIR